MTDIQLLCFIRIAELGSFSEAALELNISQSSVSKQILHLEEELGVSLFDRSKRRPRLSDAGEHLYQDAVIVLKQIIHMKNAAHTLAADSRCRISLLSLPLIGHYNLYVPIQLFENDHPGVDISLEELEEPELNSRIRQGDFDAAVTYFSAGLTAAGAKFYPQTEDEMVLVCPKGHALSGRDSVSPEELDGLPVFSMQKYTCISQLYDLYFRKHRSNPRIIFRGRPESILVGAESGRAPALLSRIHTNAMKMQNVNLIPFSPPLKGVMGTIINPESPNAELLQELADSLKA